MRRASATIGPSVEKRERGKLREHGVESKQPKKTSSQSRARKGYTEKERIELREERKAETKENTSGSKRLGTEVTSPSAKPKEKGTGGEREAREEVRAKRAEA